MKLIDVWEKVQTKAIEINARIVTSIEGNAQPFAYFLYLYGIFLVFYVSNVLTS
jgi:hypothetical protein